MKLPIVQILLKDRVLQKVPFRGETLRIGRMKENDIVINNLAVSRFHAALHRSGDEVELEDLGSENGCYLNGARVRGRVRVGPGDEVRIGKHALVWRVDDAASDASPAPSPGRSDAWDAAQTYFAPAADADLPAALGDDASAAPTGPPVEAPSGPGESPTDLEIPGLAARAAGAELDLASDGADLSLGDPDSDIDPEAEGLDLDAGEAEALDLSEADALTVEDAVREDLAGTPDDEVDLLDGPGTDLGLGDEALEAALEAEVDAPASDAASADPAEESLFDFDPRADLAGSDPQRAPLAVDEDEAAGEDAPQSPAADEDAGAELTAGRYPGLILQRGGRLERIVAWDEDRLAAALDERGILHLAADAAPARAVFVREQDRFRVRGEEGDGLAVNGAPVAEHTLEVGDVVSLADWKLTFVLDHEPVRSEVLTAPPDEPAETAAAEAQAPEDRAPEPAEADPEPPTVEMGVPDEGDASRAEVDLLVEPEDDEEKELPVTIQAVRRGGPAQVPTGPMAPLLVELEIRPQDLPAPLRDLVDALEGGEVSVPVRLRLRAGRAPGQTGRD